MPAPADTNYDCAYKLLDREVLEPVGLSDCRFSWL